MNRIRDLRQRNGWRQEDLAERLNAKPQTVSRYEKEERQLDPPTISKLCNIFGCTADYLLGRSEVESFELSADEAELLRGYRALSPTGKEYLRHTMALAALAHTEKSGDLPGMEAVE